MIIEEEKNLKVLVKGNFFPMQRSTKTCPLSSVCPSVLSLKHIISQNNLRQYMGGISQDVKRLKMWDFFSLFFEFS